MVGVGRGLSEIRCHRPRSRADPQSAGHSLRTLRAQGIVNPVVGMTCSNTKAGSQARLANNAELPRYVYKVLILISTDGWVSPQMALASGDAVTFPLADFHNSVD